MEITTYEDKSTAVSIARVSKGFCKWIKPLIYRAIQAGDYDGQIVSLSRTLQSSRPENPGKHVLRMRFKDAYLWAAYEEVDVILRACTRLECLILTYLLPGDAPHAKDDAAWPAPWHVMLKCWHAPHPLMRNVTHLYLGDMQEMVLGDVQMLPCLTHLGLAFFGDNDNRAEFPLIIGSFLGSTPSLVILLLFACLQEDPTTEIVGDRWVEMAEIQDERLLARVELSEQDIEAVVKWGACVWDNAETRYKGWRDLCVGVI